MLYVAAAPEVPPERAQLQAHITELRSELNELKPKHTQLLEAQQGAHKARQDAEKARDDALAHLQELQRQGADEDSIKGADQAFAQATTLLNRREACYHKSVKSTEHTGETMNTIRKSITTIYATIAAIAKETAAAIAKETAAAIAKETAAAIAKETSAAIAKETSAANGTLLVLLLCLATALPHGS